MKNPALRLLLLTLTAFAAISEPVERYVQRVFEWGEPTNLAELETGETFTVSTLYGGATVRAALTRPDKPEGPELSLVRPGDVVLGPARLYVSASQAGATAVGRIVPTTNALSVRLTLEVATNSPAVFFRASKK
jgi:hypothetical protein